MLQAFLVSEGAGRSLDGGISKVWVFNHHIPVCVSKTTARNHTRYPGNPEQWSLTISPGHSKVDNVHEVSKLSPACTGTHSSCSS